jgi:O-antigen/teichoic acid export membrane protein
VLTQWSMRVADYNVVNVSRLTQSVTLVAGQVVGALSGFGGTGLMAGDAVGRLAGAASLWHKAWGTHRPVFRALRARDLREMALRYRRFPLISSGSALVNVGGIVLPTIFLSAFGAAPLGWFALVDRVIGSPSSLVGLGVLQVYSAKAAKLAHDDPEALRTLFRDVMLRLAWTGILPFAALASLGPWAFAFVFGESWRPAGEYARVLALMQYVGFVTWPLLHTLNILEHQGWQLVWDIGRLVACALAMWAAARFGGSAMWVVVAYSFSMLLCYCVHVALSYLAINGRIRTMRSRAGR